MITVKVGEPTTKNIGDVWFDPTTKLTHRAEVINSGLASLTATVAIAWRPMHPSPLSSAFPTKGDIEIDPITLIPSLYDGNSWIPAVPSNYNFPPSNPSIGTAWTDPLTQVQYFFFNGVWNSSLNLGTTGQVIPPNGNWTVVPTTAPQTGNSTTTSSILPPIPLYTFTGAIKNLMTINGPGNTMLVSIDASGKITYGVGYTPDAAAQTFWEAISGTSPKTFQDRITDLVKDLKDATSRLATAEDTILKFAQAGFKLPEQPKPIDPIESWNRAMGIII